jgi:pimeloyl-ACP methyl ester carboxylesterase
VILFATQFVELCHERERHFKVQPTTMNFPRHSRSFIFFARCWRKLLVGFALVAALMLFAGCVTPQGLANRIAKAPNLQYGFLPDKQWQKWSRMLFRTNDPFQYLTIPVGPPEAKLSVMELPAANYNVEVRTRVVRQTNGTRDFVLEVVQKTNAVTAPLKELGTIVLLHGYMMQKETMVPWAIVLAQAGYRVVLVDVRGHGQSTGQTFTAGKYETADLIQMLDYLTAQKLCDPSVGVLGHSFGADLALFWAARDLRVKTVVAIAPYNKPDEAIPRLAKALKWPISTNKLQQAIVLAEPKLGIKWSDWTAESALAGIQEPVLLIGGVRDIISPPQDLRLLKRAAPAGSQAILIPAADHFVIGYWFQELATPVKEWFQQHLPPPEP